MAQGYLLDTLDIHKSSAELTHYYKLHTQERFQHGKEVEIRVSQFSFVKHRKSLSLGGAPHHKLAFIIGCRKDTSELYCFITPFSSMNH